MKNKAMHEELTRCQALLLSMTEAHHADARTIGDLQLAVSNLQQQLLKLHDDYDELHEQCCPVGEARKWHTAQIARLEDENAMLKQELECKREAGVWAENEIRRLREELAECTESHQRQNKVCHDLEEANGKLADENDEVHAEIERLKEQLKLSAKALSE